MSRWPRPFLTERIAEYYRDNPDEELSYPQMRAKFGCSIDQLRSAIHALRRHDVLHTVSLCVIRAGPTPYEEIKKRQRGRRDASAAQS